MITLTFAIVAALGCWAALWLAADWSLVWSILTGIAAFGVIQALVGLFLRKRITREQERIQGILAAGQKRMQAKTQRWQLRPPSSIQAAQREMFEDTKVFVREAIKETASLEKYRLFIPMFGRQIATMRMQLLWMIKDFKAVDELLPKALYVDPTLSAIKMARLYMLDKPLKDIEKVYEKAVRRLRYNQNVLLAATWSWMQVKRGDVDGAFKTLTEALKKSDNETLKRNHELLMNNRSAQFTNSLIGDTWYALYLEEPKFHAQRQRQVYR